MVFLAILVPAIAEALRIANRASLVAERSSIAGELAENKLNEVLLSSTGGATNAARETGGDFGAEWPGYRWEMNEGTWSEDSVNPMSEMSVRVFYPVQGEERSVTLTTLVSGTEQNP